MTHEHSQAPEDDPIWAEARALEASIRAIRRAQGKANPEDFAPDSPQCIEAMDAFVRDISRVLALYARDARSNSGGDLHGAGAAG